MMVDDGFSLTAEIAVVTVEPSFCSESGDVPVVSWSFAPTRTNQHTRTVPTISQKPGGANLPPAPD
jgi:hypothetical protein